MNLSKWLPVAIISDGTIDEIEDLLNIFRKQYGIKESAAFIMETGTVEAIDRQEKAIVLSAAYIPCSDIIGLEGDDIPECAGEVEVSPYDGPD